MISIGYFILSFSLLQWLIALMNLISGKFTYKSKSRTEPEKLVSVLIPARNEERTIGNILKDLLLQEYSTIEIIVFDDMSDDRTAEIVSEISLTDRRIKLMRSAGLPAGWQGKNFACHTMSDTAAGNYLLFLDADVRIARDLIRNTISYAEKHQLALFSIFPQQIMLSIGEWSTVPSMNYILLTLLPLILVRKSTFSSLAAANGQFMLFRSDTYREHMPHSIFRGNRIEDIEIARYLKRRKLKIACLAGNTSIQCRMYQNYQEAINGFSKNVIGFFGNSFILAILFWLVTTFGFLIVLFTTPILFFLVLLGLIISVRIMVSMTSGQNILRNLLFIIPQQAAIGLFILKAFINSVKKQYKWKGRNISL